ncbi:MAG: TnsA endonuclease N-terminal domain-containing protein [Chloroflexi bacterium]|nr:TnsA endonuclease N-terminal domain-containing protein [Chloroflexota bacterium]
MKCKIDSDILSSIKVKKESDMPVRKVSNHSRNVIGRFPFAKMGRMIAFESLLERDFIYLLEYDPSVKWFEEQPLSIKYLQEGKQFQYTPDFHLLENGQHVLVECKPQRFVETEENRHKFAVARVWRLWGAPHNRHTCAFMLRTAGVDIERRAKMLGHSVKTASKYGAPGNSEIEKTAALLDHAEAA